MPRRSGRDRQSPPFVPAAARKRAAGVPALDGQVAVVTGGLGGIGRAVVASLAGHGAAVVSVDVRAAEEHSDEGVPRTIAADVSDASSVKAAIDTVVYEYGRIDILCNCSGIADGLKTAGELDDATWDRVMAVNAKGVFLTIRTVLPHMLEQSRGIIVNVASVAGVTGGASGVAYTASKHAVIGITKNTAAFYASSGIRCNAVCPGGIDSGMPLLTGGDRLAEDRVARIRERMPRRGSPQEIAEVVGFLASDASSLMNGAVLVADAGWMAF